MNIFELAYKQLDREGLRNKENETLNLIDRAVIIRNYLILSSKKKKARRKVK
jgi:hypothetical protein